MVKFLRDLHRCMGITRLALWQTGVGVLSPTFGLLFHVGPCFSGGSVSMQISICFFNLNNPQLAQLFVTKNPEGSSRGHPWNHP